MKQSSVIAGLVLALLGSLGFAARMWSWVLNFDPGFTFSQPAAPTGLPLSSGVTLILVDGLRLDASRRMATLNALRSRGADIEARVGTPSFSRPGRATIAVGAPPDIHGVTTNRQKRMLSIDNLFRRVSAVGGACRVAGSKIWSGLFGDDIARCGVYQPGEGKEGPGAFARQVGEVRAAQERGLDFILQQPVLLRVADIISTDFAAHEYGGTSTEYAAEVARVDRYLADLVTHLDLSKETLVVTADHGHRDAGGHGGEEPEVLAIPLVMVGAGITPATTAVADQADIAPTVAALLGLALPAGSSGLPIVSALLADDTKLDLVRHAAALQKVAFDQAVAARLGLSVGEDGHSDWRALRHAYRDAEMSSRTPTAVFLALAVVLGALVAIYCAQPGSAPLATGLLVATMASFGSVRLLLPSFSFSAINYDEMLIPFFARIMTLAALVTVGSIACAALAGRFSNKARERHSPSVLAGATGLLGTCALAVFTIAAWLHHGLLLPLALPGPGRLVEAYALTLAITSVSLTSLIVVSILRAFEARAAGRESGRN